MERAGKSPEKTTQEAGPPPSLVTAFVTALKNIAIYPASHPRVTSAAAEFVGHLGQRCAARRSCLIVGRGDTLLLDDERFEADGTTIGWLLARFRDAGLRGVECTAECTAEDVVGFATALNQSRARHGTALCDNWSSPTKHVVPLPLVYQGRHDADATEGATEARADEATAAAYRTPQAINEARLRAAVDKLATKPEIQKRLRAITMHAHDSEGGKKVDLFETISELLPADVANNPAMIEDVVGRILGRVEESLGELVRRKSQVKGAGLLRKALGVARKYFQTGAPKQVMPAGLPSGRPEDDKIVADLGLLLQEIDALPEAGDLRLPAAAETTSSAQLVAREMFGILLHAVASGGSPGALRKLTDRLRKARSTVVADVQDVFAVYVGPKADPSATGMATRHRVLEALFEAGHAELVRKCGFLDAGYVTRGFPEILPLATRVLGNDDQGRTILREGLEGVATVLAAGGVAATEATGALADPQVVKVLALTGGPVANSLIAQAAAKALPAVRQVLRDHLLTCDLPAPEASVLLAHPDAETLPRDYLHQLTVAVTQRRLDPSLRAASGALMRQRAMLGREKLAPDARLLAIRELVHVPGAETESLLRHLARDGRFFRLSPRARALRACARATLAAIEKERRK